MAADTEFMGYQVGKRKMLAGLPLGDIAVEDEYLHAPAASGHYSATETSYFGFSIPEQAINAEIYVWFHPVLRVMSAGVLIWRGMKGRPLACEYSNYQQFLPFPENGIADYRIEALNLHIRVIEPLKSIEISFADEARGVRLRCRQDAIMPPAVRPGGFHFTQAMRVTGELDLHGETLKIDGYSSRDRSWGQERREDPMALPPMSWMVGVFDDHTAFHVLAYDDPALSPEWAATYPGIAAGENLFWGYIYADGELISVRSARKRTIRDAGGLHPRSFEMGVEDVKGRSFAIRGEVQARAPWHVWHNIQVICCQTRWEMNGKIGYGDTQEGLFNHFTRSFETVAG